MPEFYVIFAREINKFTDKKYFSRFFFLGGGACAVSYAYGRVSGNAGWQRSDMLKFRTVHLCGVWTVRMLSHLHGMILIALYDRGFKAQ